MSKNKLNKGQGAENPSADAWAELSEKRKSWETRHDYNMRMTETAANLVAELNNMDVEYKGRDFSGSSSPTQNFEDFESVTREDGEKVLVNTKSPINKNRPDNIQAPEGYSVKYKDKEGILLVKRKNIAQRAIDKIMSKSA